MKLVSYSSGPSRRLIFQADTAFSPGSSAWDSWTLDGALARRAVHELLFDQVADHPPPAFPALLLARKAMQLAQGVSRALIWLDPFSTFYPPAAIAAGIPAGQLYMIRPQPADLIWTAVECLRCLSVGAVVALLPGQPSRVQVRRLQLAAERGGGVAILLRAAANSAARDVYAATARWLISPACGERTIQRWTIQLIHGQGGHLGQSFLLEKPRGCEAYPVHSSPALAHHAAMPAAIHASS